MLDKIASWDDYWREFDLLVDNLKLNGQGQLVKEFKDAQKYVNGLTDGWFDFKAEMEKTLQLNKTKMTSDQVDIANNLIEKLNDSLTRRG